jgi:hypothetical protein
VRKITEKKLEMPLKRYEPDQIVALLRLIKVEMENR